MTDQLWYYELLAEEMGPVQVEEIQHMASRGMLSVEDRVRPKSSSQWITVAELKHALQDSSFPDSLSSTQMLESHSQLDIHSADLDIESFKLQSDKEALHEDRNSDLDIDSIKLLSDSQVPLPAGAMKKKSSATKLPNAVDTPKVVRTPTYMIKTLGQVVGPLDEASLVEMARTGELTRDDAYKSEDGKWISVRTIPAVYAQIARRDVATARLNAPTVTLKSSTMTTVISSSTAGSNARASKSSRSPARARKAAPKDAFLQEIFSEVFTEQGDLNQERLKRPSAAAAVVTTAPTAIASSNVSATPAYSAPQATQHQFKPSPKSYPKKKKSSGSSFELPEPKVLGMVGGGILAVLLLVGVMTGFVTMPGMGVDAEGFFKEVAVAYTKAHDGSVEEWKLFTETYRQAAREVAKGLSSRAESDPKAKRQVEAALLIVKLCGESQKAKESLENIYSKFNQKLLGN